MNTLNYFSVQIITLIQYLDNSLTYTMPGIFSKTLGWILNGIKLVSKIANLAHRGVLFAWHDELGLRVVGSPMMLEKFNGCRNCATCQEQGSWDEKAKMDSVSLATGKVHVDIDLKASNEELIMAMNVGHGIEKLPCRLEYMTTIEAFKWLEVEIKKDFIEQGKKPVKRIPWGNTSYRPKCWAEYLWKWENVNNPHHKQMNPPETGVRLIDVLQVTIANRLEEKGIDPGLHVSDAYTEEMDRKKRNIRGIKLSANTTKEDTQEHVFLGVEDSLKELNEESPIFEEMDESTENLNKNIADNFERVDHNDAENDEVEEKVFTSSMAPSTSVDDADFESLLDPPPWSKNVHARTVQSTVKQNRSNPKTFREGLVKKYRLPHRGRARALIANKKNNQLHLLPKDIRTNSINNGLENLDSSLQAYLPIPVKDLIQALLKAGSNSI